MDRPTRRPATLLFRALVLLTALAFPACSDDDSPTQPETEEPDVEQPAPPTVVQVPAAELPPIDRDVYKFSCPRPAGSGATCPVIRWQGMDYAALSYRDNRISFAVHAWDAAGALRSVQEYPGARYVDRALVDTLGETVSFVGQSDREIVLTWAELEAMR